MLYIGDLAQKAEKVTNIYVGTIANKAAKVTKIYMGDVGNKARLVYSIAHFCERNAMNIDGLGEKRVEAFFNNKILNSFEDIYKFLLVS